MRKLRRYLIMTAAALLCLALGTVSALAAGLDDLSYTASTEAQNPTTVHIQSVSGRYWLFLPSSADLSALTLDFDAGTAYISSGRRSAAITSGEPFDFAGLFDGAPRNGVYTVYLSSGRKYLSLSVMRSENLRSMYITSADPEKDRTWVELDKDNKAKNDPMVLLRADGSCVYDGVLKNIKGRGNSTWEYPKRPYQIKLDKKTDLLDAGESPETTWVLLANYADPSLIRNSLTFCLADRFGAAYSPNCQMTDLYYDGEYRGTYLLSEKTEVGKGRVQINDLDKDIEDANPDVEDLDDLPVAVSANKYGNQYQYVTGIETPREYRGGYLLEMDFEARAKEEKSWFITANGKYIVCKSPEYATQDMMEYISGLYQKFENAVYNGGVDPETGKSYTDYMDLESLARTYLILELSMDGDAFQSSTFFNKPAGEEKLYAGPVWDFDSAYGGYDAFSSGGYTGLQAGNTGIGRKLLSIPGFREAVKEYYIQELYPMINTVVLNGGEATVSGRLKSIAGYAAESAASREMNVKLWPERRSYDECTGELADFLRARSQWLYDEIIGWQSEEEFVVSFDDVAPEAWYHDAVCYVVEKNLFAGISEKLFDPNTKLSRVMAVTVLYRMAGRPVVTGSVEFEDVAPGVWYTDAVLWAVENDISTGKGNGRFGVDESITREELVTLFYRYARASGMDVESGDIPEEYVDAGRVSSWAREAFAWALENGIINGTDPKTPTLSPLYSSTRAQAAVMFQRYSAFAEKTGDSESE